MNNGIDFCRKNKRKAPLTECEKPTRFARVLLERLPSTKHVKKEGSILNHTFILPQKSIGEDEISNTSHYLDTQSRGLSIDHLNLDTSKKQFFKDEETQNSITDKSQKKKRKFLLDSTQIPKINLSPIVLLEKLSVDNILKQKTNKEIDEPERTINIDDQLIGASSQNDKIEIVDNETKRANKYHTKSEFGSLDAESIQNKQICIKLEVMNISSDRSNENIGSQQELSTSSTRYNSINNENISHDSKQKNNNLEEFKINVHKTINHIYPQQEFSRSSNRCDNVNTKEKSSDGFRKKHNKLEGLKINIQIDKSNKHILPQQEIPSSTNRSEKSSESFSKKNGRLQEFQENSVKNININKKQKLSSHYIIKEDLQLDKQVPCRQKSKAKEKKLIAKNNLLANQTTSDISVFKDNNWLVDEQTCHKEESYNNFEKISLNTTQKLDASETLSITKCKSKGKVIKTQEKSTDQKFFENEKKYTIDKLESKPEYIHESLSHLNKYPKICIERICPNDLSNTKNLSSSKNLLFNTKLCQNTTKSDVNNLQLSNNLQDSSEKKQLLLEPELSENSIENVNEKEKDFSDKNFNDNLQTQVDKKVNVRFTKNQKLNPMSKSCSDCNSEISSNHTNKNPTNTLVSDVHNFEDEKKLSEYNLNDASLLTNKDSFTKSINEIPQKLNLKDENDSPSSNKIEDTLLKNKQDNMEKNIQQLLNSSGDSNRSSDDGNFSSDSEDYHLKEKFIVSKTISKRKNDCLSKKKSNCKLLDKVKNSRILESNTKHVSTKTVTINESDTMIQNKKLLKGESSFNDFCFKKNLCSDEEKSITSTEVSSKFKPANTSDSNGVIEKVQSPDKFFQNKKSRTLKISNNSTGYYFSKNKKDNIEESVINFLHDERITNQESTLIKDTFADSAPHSMENNMVNEKKEPLKNLKIENEQEISNDSVIENESIETDEILDEEDFSNDSIENKKIFIDHEFDSDSQESTNSKNLDNSYAKSHVILESTEKFEICLEQEVSNDSALDDKLSECKKIALDEELIVNTEIYLEQEVSSDSGTEEKKSTNMFLEKKILPNNSTAGEKTFNDNKAASKQKKIYKSSLKDMKLLNNTLFSEEESRKNEFASSDIITEIISSRNSEPKEKRLNSKDISVPFRTILKNSITKVKESINNDTFSELAAVSSNFEMREKELTKNEIFSNKKAVPGVSKFIKKESTNNIFSEQEIASTNSVTKENNFTNIVTFSEQESLASDQEFSNNSSITDRLSDSGENSKVCDSNFVSSSSSDDTFITEVFMEQEISHDSEEFVLEPTLNRTNKASVEKIIRSRKFLGKNEKCDSLKAENVPGNFIEDIQSVVDYSSSQNYEHKIIKDKFEKEILKGIVANEHSYYKDGLDISLRHDKVSKNKLQTTMGRNPYFKTNTKNNFIRHSLQEENSIINAEGCKVKSFDGVVGKIQNQLDNLKDQCSSAITKVTDIIRDCSFKIERDLNELKKRHEDENITNEKLLVINLDENRDSNKTLNNYKSEEHIQAIEINDQIINHAYNNLNSEEFSTNSITNCRNINYDEECVVEFLQSSINIEDVKVDIKNGNKYKQSRIEELSEKPYLELSDNLRNVTCHKVLNKQYNGQKTSQKDKDVLLNQKIKTLNNHHTQKFINDHTYAGPSFVQNSGYEISDHEQTCNIILLKDKIAPVKKIDKRKNSWSSVLPDTTTKSFDDKNTLNEENQNEIEKDATTNLKEMCKKIAARINPDINECFSENPPVVVTKNYTNKSISDLLYICGSDEDVSVQNNLNENQKIVTQFSSDDLKQNLINSFERESISEKKETAKTDLLVTISGDEHFTKDALNNVPMKCPKCSGIYFGYQRIKKHILVCGEEPNLSCPWCSRKLKYRQSLIKHFQKFHSDAVRPKDAQRIADELENQARALCTRKKSIELPYGISALGHMPDFLKLYCDKCKLLIDWEPSNDRICTVCFEVMTINCQNCERYDVLYDHVNFHVKGQCAPVRVSTTLKCNSCPFRTYQKFKLYEHVLKKHSTQPASVEIFEVCTKGCGRKFNARTPRLRHERHCGKAPDRFCKFCPFKSKHRSAIKVHIQQHVLNGDGGGETVFGDCGIDESLAIGNFKTSIEAQTNGKNKSEYENRIRSKMSASCNTCRKSVKIMDTSNICDCGRLLIFTCNICNLKKCAYHPIRVHVIRRHLEKPFKCNICWRSYSYFPDYKNHSAKCGQEPEKICTLCNFRTFSAKSMLAHKKKIHGTRVTLPMCQKCGKTFTLSRTLARHEERYCGVEAKLSCEHCSFMTKSKFSLKRHLQSIHYKIFTNVRFECENCMKEFSSLYSRDTHARACCVVWSPESY